nr:MAG TPA: hypothetical protein [Caudoviricetes sp.]
MIKNKLTILQKGLDSQWRTNYTVSTVKQELTGR